VADTIERKVQMNKILYAGLSRIIERIQTHLPDFSPHFKGFGYSVDDSAGR